MFILSVAALAVYWKYIRENIPLDFHHPSNTLSHANSGDFDTPDIINSSDDGNNSFINSSQTIETTTASPASQIKHSVGPSNNSHKNNKNNTSTTKSNYNKVTTGPNPPPRAASNPLLSTSSPLAAAGRRLSGSAYQRIDYQSLGSSAEGNVGSASSARRWIVHM